MYISPPQTSGIHQPLDHIFKQWHTTFNGIVAAWCKAHTGRELDKATFTALFSEAWPKWVRTDMIVAAFRRCGITVDGLNPEAVDSSKFVLSQAIHGPAQPLALTGPSTDPLTLTDATTPQTALAPLTRARTAPDDQPMEVEQDVATELPLLTSEWVCPSPPPESYRTQTEYWKEKQRLTEEMAGTLFAQLKQLQQTPITLKASHPAWQPRVKSPEPDKADGRKTLKGEWGDVNDMDGADLLGRLDEQREKDEVLAIQKDERKRDMEQRRAEREEEAAKKKAERDDRLALEMPVTLLLQRLSFVEPNCDDVSAGDLKEFVRMNRAQLKSIDINYTNNGARVKLMPLLIEKLALSPEVDWACAPPKALPAPQPDPAQPVETLPAPPALPTPHAARDDTPPRRTPAEPTDPPSPTHSRQAAREAWAAPRVRYLAQMCRCARA